MRIASTKDDISSIFMPSMLACAFAYAALKLVGSITNGYLYPLVATTDGWIREISTLVIAATFLATTAVAYRKPQIVRAPALVALACVFTLAAIAFVGAGLSAHNVALLSLGIFCRSIGRALTLCLFALCLVQLKSGKQVSFAIALGLFIFSVLAFSEALSARCCVSGSSASMCLLGRLWRQSGDATYTAAWCPRESCR